MSHASIISQHRVAQYLTFQLFVRISQVVYVVGGKSAGVEEAHDMKKRANRDPYVYCDDLKMRGMSLHLSLMFTGNSDDVRRYVGPVVQVCMMLSVRLCMACFSTNWVILHF